MIAYYHRQRGVDLHNKMDEVIYLENILKSIITPLPLRMWWVGVLGRECILVKFPYIDCRHLPVHHGHIHLILPTKSYCVCKFLNN